MSKLKATTAQEIVRNEKDCDYMDELFGGVKMPHTQVYLKSEADKVIAELEMKLAAAKLVLRLNEPKALYSNLDTMSRLNHKIDVVERRELHQKYKRCLAMAERCLTEKVYWHYRYNDYGDKGYTREYKWRKVELWCKWAMRWLKIAEKFKLEEERRWRKFPDEKPKEWETVIVRFGDGFYDLAVYMSNGQGWDIGDGRYHKSEEVSHWMPLPKFEEK
jgi:hypothetical protein